MTNSILKDMGWTQKTLISYVLRKLDDRINIYE